MDKRKFNKKLNLSNVTISRLTDKFKKKFRIKLNLAQTILYHNNKVVDLKPGTLDGNDFLALLKKVKSLRGTYKRGNKK